MLGQLWVWRWCWSVVHLLEDGLHHLASLDVCKGSYELVLGAGPHRSAHSLTETFSHNTHLFRLSTLDPSRKSVVTSRVMR